MEVFVIPIIVVILLAVTASRLSKSSSELARKVADQIRVFLIAVFGVLVGFVLGVYELAPTAPRDLKMSLLNNLTVKYAVIGGVAGVVVGILIVMAFPTNKQQPK